MILKKTKKLAAAATFGAAMTAMYTAPELQASVVPLTFMPSTVPFGGVSFVFLSTTGSAFVGTFVQINSGTIKGVFGSGLASVGTVMYSQSLTTNFALGGSNVVFSSGASGMAVIGFTAQSGNHGWFSMNLGGLGGPITYLNGGYNNMGGPIHVGTVPEPATAGLALLALGAVGLMRKRKK